MRLIFPPKNLEKYGAQNTHAPDFFLKFNFTNKVNIFQLLSYCIVIY